MPPKNKDLEREIMVWGIIR